MEQFSGLLVISIWRNLYPRDIFWHQGAWWLLPKWSHSVCFLFNPPPRGISIHSVNLGEAPVHELEYLNICSKNWSLHYCSPMFLSGVDRYCTYQHSPALGPEKPTVTRVSCQLSSAWPCVPPGRSLLPSSLATGIPFRGCIKETPCSPAFGEGEQIDKK